MVLNQGDQEVLQYCGFKLKFNFQINCLIMPPKTDRINLTSTDKMIFWKILKETDKGKVCHHA